MGLRKQPEIRGHRHCHLLALDSMSCIIGDSLRAGNIVCGQGGLKGWAPIRIRPDEAQTQGHRQWWDSVAGSERFKTSPDQSTRKWWLRDITPAGPGLSSLPEVTSTFPVLYFAPGNKVCRNKYKNPQRNRTSQIPGSGDKEGRIKAED